MGFKKFLKNLEEEMQAADIAGVDTKLDFVRRDKKRTKGKKCKMHKRYDCQECKDRQDNKYN